MHSTKSQFTELQCVEAKDLYRLCSRVRAEIPRVRLEPELLSAGPAAGAVPAGN